MSPEQASAQPVDARSDQYSLASVLYEMLVGRAAVHRSHRAGDRRAPSGGAGPRDPSGAPRGAGRRRGAVLRALERVPADRFPDVAAFADALRSHVRRRARRSESGRARSVLRHRRRRCWSPRSPSPRGRWGTGGARDPSPATRTVVALYQRGVHEYDKRTPAGNAGATQAFTAAVGRDSTYAEAWAGLARTYVQAYDAGVRDSRRGARQRPPARGGGGGSGAGRRQPELECLGDARRS